MIFWNENMINRYIFCVTLFLISAPGYSQRNSPGDMKAFQKLMQMDWMEVFEDEGTDDWQAGWTLDGKKARIINTAAGMEFHAGPVPGDDASHSVIWTRRSFSGDIRIEYEYTRLDTATRYVNIIYLLATGSGAGGYPEDILEWSGSRSTPAMRMYYDHMNLLHISYAAFENTNTLEGNDYIRARRYLPETGKGLEGTELKPDYFRTGMFKPGDPHRITIIKCGNDLYMKITNPERELVCHWDLSGFPVLEKGRVGIRHMGSRAARYRDFRIYELNRKKD
jgi:hypothetical protein